MVVRGLKNRLEAVPERKLGRLLLCVLASLVFLQQLQVFLTTNHVKSSQTVQSNNIDLEKLEDDSKNSNKDPSMDFQCQCKELKSNQSSMCSDYSNSLGDHQKVISVSLFSDSDVAKVRDLSDAVYQTFPGYYLRLYHNVSEHNNKHSELCDLFCQNHHIDLCHAKKIGESIVMSPGISEPENPRPNPTFSYTRHTRTRHFKSRVYPYPPEPNFNTVVFSTFLTLYLTFCEQFTKV